MRKPNKNDFGFVPDEQQNNFGFIPDEDETSQQHHNNMFQQAASDLRSGNLSPDSLFKERGTNKGASFALGLVNPLARISQNASHGINSLTGSHIPDFLPKGKSLADVLLRHPDRPSSEFGETISGLGSMLIPGTNIIKGSKALMNAPKLARGVVGTIERNIPQVAYSALTNENPEEGALYGSLGALGGEALSKVLKGARKLGSKFMKRDIKEPNEIPFRESKIGMEEPVSPDYNKLKTVTEKPKLEDFTKENISFKKDKLPVKSEEGIKSSVEKEHLPRILKELEQHGVMSKIEAKKTYNELSERNKNLSVGDIGDKSIEDFFDLSHEASDALSSRTRKAFERLKKEPYYPQMHDLNSSLKKDMRDSKGSAQYHLGIASEKIDKHLASSLSKEDAKLYKKVTQDYADKVKPFDLIPTLKQIRAGKADTTGVNIDKVKTALESASKRHYEPNRTINEKGEISEGGQRFKKTPFYQHQKFINDEIEKNRKINEQNIIHNKKIDELAKNLKEAEKKKNNYESQVNKHKESLNDKNFHTALNKAQSEYKIKKSQYDEKLNNEKERIKKINKSNTENYKSKLKEYEKNQNTINRLRKGGFSIPTALTGLIPFHPALAAALGTGSLVRSAALSNPALKSYTKLPKDIAKNKVYRKLAQALAGQRFNGDNGQ